jgi:two-component system, NtrC family, response regulator HydG
MHADIDSRLVGTSPRCKSFVQQVKKLAVVRTPVLLQGETGTGKTAIAEIFHASSGETGSQLVRIDCSLSSEASFPGRAAGRERRPGGEWVHQAKGGTLFLRHLQCLPLRCRRSW